MQLDCIMMQCSRSAALITYDYLLTVRREANLFWRQKINAASILFFVNRYFAVVYYVGLAYYRCLVLPFPVSRYYQLTKSKSSCSHLMVYVGVGGCNMELGLNTYVDLVVEYMTTWTLRSGIWSTFRGQVCLTSISCWVIKRNSC